MHRFWQSSEYSEWAFSPEADPHDPWAFAKGKSASRVTVMALTHDPDISGGGNVGYSGPIFFDIDDKNVG
jgi:hypothetical protein